MPIQKRITTDDILAMDNDIALSANSDSKIASQKAVKSFVNTKQNTLSGTGIVKSTAGVISYLTDNSSNWDTAYTDRNKWDGGSTGLVAATGRTSLGATTVGSNMFTLTNPSAITFPRFNADNTISALDAASFRTAIGAGTSTVTPAALTKTDDTNVTLTLGGTPATALLQATSLTLGWTGTLADGRIASAATWNAKQAAYTNLTTIGSLANANGFLRQNGAGVFSYDTNTYLTANQSITLSGGATGTGTTAITVSLTTPSSVTGVSTNTGGTGAHTHALSGIVNANLSGSAAISNANLANSAITIQGTSTSLGGSINVINGTGFVKASGTTISYDNTTYQPLLTNPITGTGVARQVSFWSGTGTQTGDAGLVYETRKTLTLENGRNSIGIGSGALNSDTQANNIIAIGYQAAYSINFAASLNNVAIGYQSLYSMTGGSGYQTTIGSENIAIGNQAGYYNVNGVANVFIGSQSGYGVAGNSNGSNIAIGYKTAFAVTTGNNNVLLGSSSGTALTTGSDNIYIGSRSGQSTTTENTTLRIENNNNTLTAAYIQGIYGKTSAGGTAVLINSSHLLGTTTSSLRYKENIVDMDDYSSSILNLRPVMFDYKEENADKHQPGLIAEEVNEIMPELVVWASKKDNQGKETEELQIETVRYLNLIPLMLNEIQKLRKEIDELKNK